MRKILTALCALLLAALLCAQAETGVTRVLSIGITKYDDGRTRGGGVNSTQGVFDAFSRGLTGECTMLLDLTNEEFYAAITDTFAEATEDDVSILYINAHGGAEAGLSFVETSDGLRVTAAHLESALWKIDGRVVLLLDCCNSGGFTGSESEAQRLSGDAYALDSFASGKYLVMVSCLSDENSYRVAEGSSEEDKLSTVFSRALCEGLGWDLIKDRPTSLKADADRDRAVTFAELCDYTRRRCLNYLHASGSVQTVSGSAADASFVLTVKS